MSIFTMIYEELQAKIKHLPEFNNDIARSAFNTLDTEAISDIILDNNTFWFEYSVNGVVNDQAYAYLVKYLRDKGYKHLYQGLVLEGGK